MFTELITIKDAIAQLANKAPFVSAKDREEYISRLWLISETVDEIRESQEYSRFNPTGAYKVDADKQNTNLEEKQ